MPKPSRIREIRWTRPGRSPSFGSKFEIGQSTFCCSFWNFLSVLCGTLSGNLYFIFAYIGLYRRVHRAYIGLYRRVHRAYIGLYRRVHREYFIGFPGFLGNTIQLQHQCTLPESCINLVDIHIRGCASTGGGKCVKSVKYRTLSVRDLYFICTLSLRDLYFIFAYIGRDLHFIFAHIGLYRRVHRAYIRIPGRTHPPPLH